MRIRGGDLSGADIVCMGSKRDDVGLGGDIPQFDGGVVGAGEDMSGDQG